MGLTLRNEVAEVLSAHRIGYDHPTGDPALQQRETCRDCDGEGTA